MNITRLNHLFCATALGSVVFLAVGCSPKDAATDVSATADKPAASKSALSVAPTPTTVASEPVSKASDQPGIAADGWAAIKDDTFTQRAHFSAGLRTMKSGMDSRIAALATKPGMMGASKTGAIMTEVTAARTNLQTASDKLDQATAATWTNDKDQVAQAWTRMQSACDKAQGS